VQRRRSSPFEPFHRSDDAQDASESFVGVRDDRNFHAIGDLPQARCDLAHRQRPIGKSVRVVYVGPGHVHGRKPHFLDDQRLSGIAHPGRLDHAGRFQQLAQLFRSFHIGPLLSLSLIRRNRAPAVIQAMPTW
jgi:hypothetical protein